MGRLTANRVRYDPPRYAPSCWNNSRPGDSIPITSLQYLPCSGTTGQNSAGKENVTSCLQGPEG